MVGGFCFYFNWFGGKTLLEEMPLKKISGLAPNLRFHSVCLLGKRKIATRTWDGLEKDIPNPAEPTPQKTYQL